MPVFQQNVSAFIDVLQSGLIPEPDRQDLIKLLDNLQDQDEQICQEIDNWLNVETRVEILKAYEKKLIAIVAAEKPRKMGPGRTAAKTTPNQPGESLKEQLKNAIQPISQPSQPSVSEDK